MKIAYIILAYIKTVQLSRLIQKLNHKDVHLYIHIDRKLDFSDFKAEFNQLMRQKKLCHF